MGVVTELQNLIDRLASNRDHDCPIVNLSGEPFFGKSWAGVFDITITDFVTFDWRSHASAIESSDLTLAFSGDATARQISSCTKALEKHEQSLRSILLFCRGSKQMVQFRDGDCDLGWFQQHGVDPGWSFSEEELLGITE